MQEKCNGLFLTASALLQHPLKDQLVAVDAALALGRAEGAVAPGLEELLHRQGLGVHGAPHTALRYRNLKPAEQENGTVPRDEVVFEHTLG